MESTVVDISITSPSFTLVPLSSLRSPLSKTSKQVIFLTLSTFCHFYKHYNTTLLSIYFHFNVNFLIYQGKNILVVAHGGTLSLLISNFLGLHIDQDICFKIRNTSVSVVEFVPSIRQSKTFNTTVHTIGDVAHLLST